MNQEEFRVKFSLKSKMLISVVLLLLIVIAFLNLSTIFILKEDKRAYIYQAQSTEAVLAGKEFTFLTSESINTIRLALASFDPRQPLSPQGRNAFQTVVNNQNKVLGMDFFFLNQENKLRPIVKALNEKSIAAQKLNPANFRLNDKALAPALDNIREVDYRFINISQVGGAPVLAILIPDKNLKTFSAGMPLAVGYIPLKSFLKDLKNAHISITDDQGWVLYDTNPEALFGQARMNTSPLFLEARKTALSSGAKEYSENGQESIGSYYKPGLGIHVFSKVSLADAMQSANALTIKFIVLAGMAIGAAVIFAILFAKRITAPLKRLYEATKEVAAGNFDLNLDVTGRDEIGALSGSFGVMSRKIQELIAETMEKVRLEAEVEVANAVQQSLIPPSHHENEFIKIQSHYESASECGGDWWGLFTVDNRLVITIADATGHGVPSALITAAARSCFSVIAKLAQENPSFNLTPSEILRLANQSIYDSSQGKIMMTYFAAIIDFKEMTMSYSSAGHNPPWYFKKTPDGYSMKSLVVKGTRLGEKPNAPPFLEKSIPIAKEDILFLYTDGILEGTNLEGAQYGKKQLRKIVEGSLSAGPEALVQNLMSDFKQHNGNKALDDDVTLAVAKML